MIARSSDVSLDQLRSGLPDEMNSNYIDLRVSSRSNRRITNLLACSRLSELF